jgi:signal transduction histidine kinase
MTIFSSLTNRIFFASALLAVLAIAVAVYRVNIAVTTQAERELQRGVEEAGTLLEEYRTTLFEHFSRETRLIADLPRLKAALDTKDPDTVQPVAEDYQRTIGSDLFVVTNPAGQVLAEAGRLHMPTADPAARDAIHRATLGHEAVSLWHGPGGVIQVVSVPSVIGAEIFGTLSVGFSLDEEAAARFKALTNSEIAFAVGDKVQASTLPASFNDRLARFAGMSDVQTVHLGDSEYVVISRKLPLTSSANAAAGGADGGAAGVPTALILRSRTERLRFLNIVHRELGVTAFLAVLAATILSYGVARTVTRPLGTITATMREMAATGDLTRRIRLSAGRWEDEDAQLLASTFNTMTESIVRFQREAAQRERLSSLGRLSTVVAHEIRNPLMIIKTALRALRADRISTEQVSAAVKDIDEEIARLNRIVNEVLDFARPIKFELAPVDVNALCADAARASAPEAGGAPVTLQLDPAVSTIAADGERLRLVLVNVLTNARHAVAARTDGSLPSDALTIKTQPLGENRVLIEVRDRGIGIAPEDLAKVFDPYFTTRRTGTGLGLAISRNIIEGLGGTIAVFSRPADGTTVRIELPIQHTRGQG